MAKLVLFSLLCILYYQPGSAKVISLAENDDSIGHRGPLELETSYKDNSHWCCSKDLTPTLKNMTRLEPKRLTRTTKYQVVTGYKPCRGHDDNWIECPVYRDMYRLETYYTNVPRVFQVLDQPVCAQEDLICCEGYSLIRGHCLSEEEADILQKFLDAGMLG